MKIHRHRLLPGHMGGTYDPRNVLRCTVEAHAFLHKRLWETFGLQEDWLAWRGLSGLIDHAGITVEVEQMRRQKISVGLTGKTASDATRQKMSVNRLGRKKPPRSVEHCQNIAAARRGMKFSSAHRQNISVGGMGNTNARGHSQVPWNKGKKLVNRKGIEPCQTSSKK